jgi:peptide/nickel transport system substrate-binding protein
MAALYDVLVRRDPASGEWVPQLAESLTPDETATSWTLVLRDGITFDSGATLDSEAVVASFERFRDPDIRNPARATVAVVDAVTVVDPRTVRFDLVRPWWDFPSLLADEPGMIVDTAVVDASGERYGSQPVGGGVGPYRFETWTPGRELVLRARDDYWAGPVCVESLRFVFVPGPGATAAAFAEGTLDVAYLRGPDSAADVARDTAVGEWTELLGSASVLLVNHGARGSTPATADERLRRAIALAVDPGAVVAAADDPALVATDVVLHPDQELWSQDLADAGPRVGVEDAVAQAADLVADVLAEAPDGGPGVVPIRLLCPNDRLAEAETIVEALSEVGFEVDLQVAASVIGVVDAVVAADYDLACWDLSLADPALGTQLRADLSPASAANRSGIGAEGLEDLLDALDATRDIDGRRGVVADIGAIVSEQIPWVPLAARRDALVWADPVSGIVPISAGVYSVAAMDVVGPSED